MRRTGSLAAEVLSAVLARVSPGVTPRELDDLCFQLAIDSDAYPSPLGYGPSGNPFPASLCVSKNEVVCHGIPDEEPLEEGDIVSLDVTVFREGVHGDTCATIGVGHVDQASAVLIQATSAALDAAIAAVRPGESLSVIGMAIEEVTRPLGLGIVRDFVGHGIGSTFHDEPHVPHYRHKSTVELEAGMTFTIEPMVTSGGGDVRVRDDDWTAITSDGSRCAQFEHTILVVPGGAEVLTARLP